MGGPYEIPRNVKGEGRILFVFSYKALIYTAAGALIGWPFYFLFKILAMAIVGVAIMAVLALIGFAIGTFKVPDTTAFEFTRKTGGEKIDDVIWRAIKFRKNKGKIYVYTEEVTKDD